MGKGTDKLYITHSEWSSSDAFSASKGASGASRTGGHGTSFRRLPFNFCAASLQPFKNPVCTADGTIFDVEVIGNWLQKHKINPVNGEPLHAKDLIRLDFARNAPPDGVADAKGDLVDPVTFKVFTDNTHIVAIRHDTYANVFAWDTVERMNIKAKMWRDLIDDKEFKRADIITLQDPLNISKRDLSSFKHLEEGAGGAILSKEQEQERLASNVNIEALGSMGSKVLRAKAAVEKARLEREGGRDVNQSSGAVVKKSQTASSGGAAGSMMQLKKIASNAAVHTTGRAAASFTSTGLTPETSGERALMTDEEYLLKPKRVKAKGFARIETNLGDLMLELHTDTAPRAVWNFIRLAQTGYYKDVAFHRNIPDFMIQGGDPSGTGRGGKSIWGKNFDDEFSGPYTHSARGVVSMANKGKNTNSSQFFIIYSPAAHLDRKHTVFGRVVDGLPVLNKMEAVPTDGSDRPLRKIVIKDVVVLVDPFDEFQRQQQSDEQVAAKTADIQRQGGTDDDRTTWTGKRIRNDGTVEQSDSGPKVGKYLSQMSAAAAVTPHDGEDDDAAAYAEWEEPARKKTKTGGGGGGFGNFDNW